MFCCLLSRVGVVSYCFNCLCRFVMIDLVLPVVLYCNGCGGGLDFLCGLVCLC